MKSIKTTFLLAVFVLMASFCFAQNQSKPVIPPKEETTKPQPGQRPKPPPTKKSSVLDKYEWRKGSGGRACAQWGIQEHRVHRRQRRQLVHACP